MRENWLKGRKLIYKGKTDQEIADILGIKLSEWLETRVTCSGPPLELKEQGAPTIDIEIPDMDMREQYYQEVAIVIEHLSKVNIQRLENYLTGNATKLPVEAIKQLREVMSQLECPEPDFSSWVKEP
jgi:transcriptional regulator with XRE-family HTH domain